MLKKMFLGFSLLGLFAGCQTPANQGGAFNYSDRITTMESRTDNDGLGTGSVGGRGDLGTPIVGPGMGPEDYR